MSVLELIEKMGEEEDRATDFISPVFFNRQVATRICGIVHTYTIPKVGSGWYKFRGIDSKRAAMVDHASFEERERYLEYLPAIRMVLLYAQKGAYYAVPLKSSGRVHTEPLPVYLCDDMVMDFDHVVARDDGLCLWFDRVDMGRDPSMPEYLRSSLVTGLHPDALKFSGLCLEERVAYALRYGLNRELLKERERRELEDGVQHAGGKLIDYKVQDDHYRVTYEVDGAHYTSMISKDPQHRVITAGICLSGGDRAFDLKSLITVMREGSQRGLIHEM